MSDIIQSVDRALELLIYLHGEGNETSITKIAADLNIYKSTVYRTLVTLERWGFVQKNPETEKYWLGPRLFTLGKSVENKLGLPELIRPYSKRLYEKCHEVVNISVLEQSIDGSYRSVIIVKEKSEQQILTVNPSVGSSNECHCSSVGKCLLAFGKDIDLSVYEHVPLTVYTRNTISSLEELRSELDKVRTQGYALDQEELEYGLTCIGAPILDHLGFAVAAISLSGPTSRITSRDFDTRIKAVVRTAAEISANL